MFQPDLPHLNHKISIADKLFYLFFEYIYKKNLPWYFKFTCSGHVEKYEQLMLNKVTNVTKLGLDPAIDVYYMYTSVSSRSHNTCPEF